MPLDCSILLSTAESIAEYNQSVNESEIVWLEEDITPLFGAQFWLNQYFWIGFALIVLIPIPISCYVVKRYLPERDIKPKNIELKAPKETVDRTKEGIYDY